MKAEDEIVSISRVRNMNSSYKILWDTFGYKNDDDNPIWNL